jgi:hypothetical protein
MPESGLAEPIASPRVLLASENSRDAFTAAFI